MSQETNASFLSYLRNLEKEASPLPEGTLDALEKFHEQLAAVERVPGVSKDKEYGVDWGKGNPRQSMSLAALQEENTSISAAVADLFHGHQLMSDAAKVTSRLWNYAMNAQSVLGDIASEHPGDTAIDTAKHLAEKIDIFAMALNGMESAFRAGQKTALSHSARVKAGASDKPRGGPA